MLKTGDRGHKTINFTQRKSEHIAAQLLREMLIGQTVYQKEMFSSINRAKVVILYLTSISNRRCPCGESSLHNQ